MLKNFASMQTLDAAELLRISTKVITQAEHNIEPIELIKLAAMLPWLTKYDAEMKKLKNMSAKHDEGR